MSDTKISEARNLLAEAFGCDPEELLDYEVRAARAVLALQSLKPQPAELAEQQEDAWLGLQRYSPNPENTEHGWMQGMREDTASGDWVHIEDLRALTTRQQVGEVQGDALSLADHITDHLCHHEYDIGGRSELLACVTEALAAHQPAGQDNPLMAYADSYRRMANLGSGRVSCLSVAYDIETNMAKHAAPPAQGIDLGLWAMHLQGPDDVHAAPSKSEALEVANAINREFARSQVKPYAVVIPWAGTAAEHAESSADWEDQWKVGNGQRDAAPGVE